MLCCLVNDGLCLVDGTSQNDMPLFLKLYLSYISGYLQH